MDELMQKLEGILSTKEGQQQLKNLQEMFLSGNLDTSSAEDTAESTAAQEQNSDMNIDINAIMGLQKLLSQANENDKDTQLLLALKPHFSKRRQERVDKAVGFMRMMTILPTLKESGILSGIFGV